MKCALQFSSLPLDKCGLNFTSSLWLQTNLFIEKILNHWTPPRYDNIHLSYVKMNQELTWIFLCFLTYKRWQNKQTHEYQLIRSTYLHYVWITFSAHVTFVFLLTYMSNWKELTLDMLEVFVNVSATLFILAFFAQ